MLEKRRSICFQTNDIDFNANNKSITYNTIAAQQWRSQNKTQLILYGRKRQKFNQFNGSPQHIDLFLPPSYVNFLIRSFSIFLQTDRHTGTRTDLEQNLLLYHSGRAYSDTPNKNNSNISVSSSNAGILSVVSRPLFWSRSQSHSNYYYYYYYYYMIYIAPISRIESEALASLGGEHD